MIHTDKEKISGGTCVAFTDIYDVLGYVSYCKWRQHKIELVTCFIKSSNISLLHTF